VINGGATDWYATIFKRLLGIIRSKGKRRFKWTRHLRVPSKEFIVPGQDILFAQRKMLYSGTEK